MTRKTTGGIDTITCMLAHSLFLSLPKLIAIVFHVEGLPNKFLALVGMCVYYRDSGYVSDEPMELVKDSHLAILSPSVAQRD